MMICLSMMTAQSATGCLIYSVYLFCNYILILLYFALLFLNIPFSTILHLNLKLFTNFLRSRLFINYLKSKIFIPAREYPEACDVHGWTSAASAGCTEAAFGDGSTIPFRSEQNTSQLAVEYFIFN